MSFEIRTGNMNAIKIASGILLAVGMIASDAAFSSARAELVSQTPTLARDYCAAFVSEAEKARESRQKVELDDLNATLDKKLAEINEKTALLEKWVSQREAIMAEATTSVLKIYETMDPTVAAQEIAKLDLVGASAIIRKMKPAKASDILKEMPPATAARIVAVISSEANLVQSGTP
jgi:flagellar motility protein MotE (MotC chaperone)